jgi:hypothetical protein
MDQFGKHALFAAGEVAVLLVLLLWAVPRIAELLQKKPEPVPDELPIFSKGSDSSADRSRPAA